MALYNNYRQGDYFVICDRCSSKRLASECTLQMNKEQSNIFVCTDRCLDKHNAQVDIVGIPDNPTVAIPRPGDGYTLYPNYTAPIAQRNPYTGKDPSTGN